MRFLRKKVSHELTIQKNWSYKIQVIKVAARAGKENSKTDSKDENQTESEDEYQFQQVCSSVLKYRI